MFTPFNEILAMLADHGIIMDISSETSMKLRSLISRLLRDQSGATAIEYVLIIGGISIVIIVAAQGLGLGVGSVWTGAQTAMDAATP
jgi:pilus assembly protein Flp/PilA